MVKKKAVKKMKKPEKHHDISERLENICQGMSIDEKHSIEEMLLEDPDALNILENDDLVSMVLDDDFTPSDKQEKIDFNILQEVGELRKISTMLENNLTSKVVNEKAANTGSVTNNLKKFSFLPARVLNFQSILNTACVILLGIFIGKNFYQQDSRLPVLNSDSVPSQYTQRVSAMPTIFSPLLKNASYGKTVPVTNETEDIGSFIVPGSLLHKDTVNVIGEHFLAGAGTESLIIKTGKAKKKVYIQGSQVDKNISKSDNLFHGIEAQMTYLFSGGAETKVPSVRITVSRVPKKNNKN